MSLLLVWSWLWILQFVQCLWVHPSCGPSAGEGSVTGPKSIWQALVPEIKSSNQSEVQTLGLIPNSNCRIYSISEFLSSFRCLILSNLFNDLLVFCKQSRDNAKIRQAPTWPNILPFHRWYFLHDAFHQGRDFQTPQVWDPTRQPILLSLGEPGELLAECAAAKYVELYAVESSQVFVPRTAWGRWKDLWPFHLQDFGLSNCPNASCFVGASGCF